MFTKQRLSKLLAVFGLALGLASSGLAAETATHKHEHDAGGAHASLSLNDGQKWATDAALRKAMSAIRAAMDASLHDIHEGKLSTARYGTLAGKVNREVGYMVSNCKLEPKADAQLHLVIAGIVEGVEAMEGKAAKVKRRDGAVKVLGALEKYAAYFDDPGFRPIAH
jgi:hypothetical protein